MKILFTFVLSSQWSGDVKLANVKTQTITPEQINRQNKLLSKLIDVEAFSFEGEVFRGNRKVAVQQFIDNNPNPSDFYVWLQDNYKRLV